MNKKQKIMLAMSGVLLVTASRTQAQNTYNNLDLLLDFRNYSTPTDPNVTVDLGNVNSFVYAVANAGLPGNTAILDTGSGYTASFSTGFSYAGLSGLLGTPSSGNQIGFSAAAADGSGSGLLYLTRTQTGTTPPSTQSGQLPAASQDSTAQAIGLIGLQTTSGATVLPGSGNNAVSYPSGGANSYQSQGQDPANSSTIDYGGSQITTAGQGGKIELQQKGSGNIYEALWAVPVQGTGSDVYEGYFTFMNNGEVTFTAVPEPATYGILAGIGLLALAVRRQIGSLNA
jgi:hypothetical protein